MHALAVKEALGFPSVLTRLLTILGHEHVDLHLSLSLLFARGEWILHSKQVPRGLSVTATLAELLLSTYSVIVCGAKMAKYSGYNVKVWAASKYVLYYLGREFG